MRVPGSDPDGQRVDAGARGQAHRQQLIDLVGARKRQRTRIAARSADRRAHLDRTDAPCADPGGAAQRDGTLPRGFVIRSSGIYFYSPLRTPARSKTHLVVKSTTNMFKWQVAAKLDSSAQLHFAEYHL